MADRILSEAVAELRLTDKRLTADFANVRARLLNSVRLLESDAKLNVRFSINEDDIINEFAQLEKFATQFAPTTKLRLNSDAALAELAALGDVVDPVVVPVVVDTESARAELDSMDAHSIDVLDHAGREGGKRFGSALTGAFKSLTGVVGVAAGGFIAGALISGFNRLTTIRDATASLTVALGDATAAATLLDDVLGVVRGTPFNLDQFALAASNMVSFGIEAKKVPGYLTAIGEAAATRGSRANEFAQRLSTIFGQITTANRIGGEELLQFSEAGVNALVILANHFQVTTGEMRDMISKGAVPAKEALDVLADGILNGSTGVAGATNAFAGTMAKLRETLTGSIGGFKAATARFGVEIIQPFEATLISGFQGATGVIDNFAARIRKAFAGITNSEFAKGLVDSLKDLPATVDKIVDGLDKIAPAIAPLLGFIGASGLGQLKTVLGPTFGALLPGISPLIAALGAFVAFTPELRDELLPVVVELAKAFAPLGAVVTEGFADIAEAAVPAISKLIAAVGELVPLISSIVDGGAALATGIVPIFTTIANIVSKIPIPVLQALVLAFAAFKAFDFVETSKGFQQVQMGMEGSFRRQGLSMEEAAVKSQRTMAGMQSAVVGAFAGMALASEDGATRITGAIGSISAVALGFATGGLWGGVAAGVGVAVGAIVGHFTEASRKSAELQKVVDDLAETYAKNTIAIIGDAEALERWNSAADTARRAEGDLGKAILNDPVWGDKLGKALVDLDVAASGTSGGSRIVDLLNEINTAGGELTGISVVMDKLTAQFGENADEVAKLIPQYGSVAKFAEALKVAQDNVGEGLSEFNTDEMNALVAGLNGETLTADDKDLLHSVFDVQKAAKELDLAPIIRQQLDLVAADNEAFRIALKNTEARLGLNRATADYNDLLKIQSAVQKAMKDDARGLLNDQIAASLKASGAFDDTVNGADVAIAALFKQAADLGVDILDLGTGITDALGASLPEYRKQADAIRGTVDEAEDLPPALTAAEQAAKDLSKAMLLSQAAVALVNEEIDKMQANLDDTTEIQNFAAGIRGISDDLGKIINESDLKEAEGLIGDIKDQREKVQELQLDVAREFEDAKLKATNLQARIEEARAAGAVRGVALLENELAHVFDKANEKEQDLAEANADLADFQARLAEISQLPVTLKEELVRQANERGISLFDLLISAPTDESRDVFQQNVSPTIDSALKQVQAEMEAKGPEAARKLAVSLRQNIIDGFIAEGFDPATAEALVAEFFDTSALNSAFTSAGTAMSAAASAELRKIFADNPDIAGLVAQLDSATGHDKVDLRRQIQDIFDEQQISLGLVPRQLTDADIAEFKKFLPVTAVPVVPELDLGFSRAESWSKLVRDTVGPIPVSVIPVIDPLTLAEWKKSGGFILGPDGKIKGVPMPGGPKSNQNPNIFLHGGFWHGGSEDHSAGIFRGMRLFAEDEPYGEGYVPLSPFKRDRGTSVVREIAAMFGYALTPKDKPMAMPGALGVTSGMGGFTPTDADLIGRAVARHTRTGQAGDAAVRFDHAVHVEAGGIVIQETSSPRRTASRLVNKMAELALRHR